MNPDCAEAFGVPVFTVKLHKNIKYWNTITRHMKMNNNRQKFKTEKLPDI